MQTYISILRGINVSGQNLIKMDALRKCYEGLGFQNIITYVQSGNVVFSGREMDAQKLGQLITLQIEKNFQIVVPVIVMSLDTLSRVIDHNPFRNNPGKDLSSLYVTFLFSEPGQYDLKTIDDKKQNGEEYFIGDDIVYSFCPNGYGKTKLNNNFWEMKFNVIATTRNWKTTNELLRIARQIS